MGFNILNLYQYLLSFLYSRTKMLKLRKSHEIVLKTYQFLVAFLAPGMDDMVQSQHGN